MSGKIKVKLCGFNEIAPLECAIQEGADFLGFVFHEPSPRNISINTAKTLFKIIPPSIPKVAVMMDASIDFLKKLHDSIEPEYFQLHKTSLAQIEKIKQTFPKTKIIRAFTVQNKEDLKQIIDFDSVIDIILFDNLNPGSGKVFDISILKDFSYHKDWFLSGGLNIQNVLKAIETTGATMVDASSGIEEIRGQKSPALIKEFMQKVKNVT